jgi:hypothetical protein
MITYDQQRGYKGSFLIRLVSLTRIRRAIILLFISISTTNEIDKLFYYKLYRNFFEKSLEYDKTYTAFYFWIEYRAYKNSDIESAASKTLKEIARLGIENGMQTLPWQTIEKILHHAAAENKINVDKIRDSKVIQARLELIRRARSRRERKKELK